MIDDPADHHRDHWNMSVDPTHTPPPPASTLDAIIAKAIREAWFAPTIPNDADQLAAVIRDALLAEGDRAYYGYGSGSKSALGWGEPSPLSKDIQRVLVIPVSVDEHAGEATP